MLPSIGKIQTSSLTGELFLKPMPFGLIQPVFNSANVRLLSNPDSTQCWDLGRSREWDHPDLRGMWTSFLCNQIRWNIQHPVRLSHMPLSWTMKNNLTHFSWNFYLSPAWTINNPLLCIYFVLTWEICFGERTLKWKVYITQRQTTFTILP